MDIKQSGEMYLETIYILSQKKGHVRSIDIAEYMDFSKPSVSRAVSILKKNGYIETDASGLISLTVAGRQVAENMYERHTLLTAFLVRLGVNEKTAVQDACKIEHDISDETFEALKRHAKQHQND